MNLSHEEFLLETQILGLKMFYSYPEKFKIFTCSISYYKDYTDLNGPFETIRFPGHNVPFEFIETEIRKQYRLYNA